MGYSHRGKKAWFLGSRNCWIVARGSGEWAKFSWQATKPTPKLSMLAEIVGAILELFETTMSKDSGI
jgi:hypothetical protein